MEKIINTKGKRKSAIARASLKAGKGRIMINNTPLENYEPSLYRIRIMEPILLSGEVGSQVDIAVNAEGGGMSSQTTAIRLAIGKALVLFAPKLKKIFLEYDRQLLVADVRLKEPAKPNRHGQARARRQKSYR
ncbi:MAG: 30S ribosomal protein S9 [archaeon]